MNPSLGLGLDMSGGFQPIRGAHTKHTYVLNEAIHQTSTFCFRRHRTKHYLLKAKSSYGMQDTQQLDGAKPHQTARCITVDNSYTDTRFSPKPTPPVTLGTTSKRNALGAYATGEACRRLHQLPNSVVIAKRGRTFQITPVKKKKENNLWK